MLEEWDYVIADCDKDGQSWLIFCKDGGAMGDFEMRRVKVKELICGCLNDGSSVCIEHDEKKVA